MNMQTELNELSIKRFADYMRAQLLPDKEEIILNAIAALCDCESDEVENLYLADYKKLALQFNDLYSDEKQFNTLLEQGILSEYELPDGRKFKVFLDEQENVLIKKSELNFLRPFFLSKDQILKTKDAIDNLHLFAAIIFRPLSYEQKNKFNEKELASVAMDFLLHMPVKFLFPFLKKIAEALKKDNELERG